MFGLLAAGTQANAVGCHRYDQLSERLSQHHGEQKLFSSFADARRGDPARTYYEFWSNPERGGWSLLGKRPVVYQINGRSVVRVCAQILAVGNHHRLQSTNQTAPAPAGRRLPGCVPHHQLERSLRREHNERPLLRALSENRTVLEIYAGEQSWTILRGRLQPMVNPLTGGALRDPDSGNRLSQLCVRPAYAGTSWRLFTPVQQSF